MTVSRLLSSSLFVQLKKKTLEVTVWDYDRSSSNDFLGEVSVFRMFELSNPLVFALFRPLLSSLMILSLGKALQILWSSVNSPSFVWMARGDQCLIRSDAACLPCPSSLRC